MMRIIGLVEADFNIALKILFTRRLMPQAERLGITPDQHGCSKNKSTYSCAMRKIILFEWARFRKEPVGSYYCDLSSCFDRMMTIITAITARKKGMAANA